MRTLIPLPQGSSTAERAAMMGRRTRDQGTLFNEFRFEDRIPENHPLRRMNVFVTAALADLHTDLEPSYSYIGQPSVNSELNPDGRNLASKGVFG